jgi:hypothetical protein
MGATEEARKLRSRKGAEARGQPARFWLSARPSPFISPSSPDRSLYRRMMR